MKKLILGSLFVISILFSGCSKDTPDSLRDDEALYPITFKVNTFKSEIGPFNSIQKSGTRGAKEMQAQAGQRYSAFGENIQSPDIRYLRYIVLNEEGIVVQTKLFESMTPDGTRIENFGTIDDRLPAGKYQFAFVGGIKPMEFYLVGYYTGVYNSDATNDIFVKVMEATVADQPIQQDVELERKVSKLEINLLDAQIPPNVDRIEYSTPRSNNHYLLFDGNYIGSNTRTRTAYVSSGSVEELYLYIFFANPSESVETTSVSIRAYDHQDGLIADKTIYDVPVGVNKKTILTGYLFDDVGSSGGQGFSVSVNNSWGNVENIEF